MTSPEPDASPALRIPANGRLDPQLALSILAAHAIPDVDERVGAEHRRPILVAGRPRVLGLRFTEEAVLVRPVAGPLAPRDEADVVALIRRWFDLDLDLGPVNALLAEDPLLAPLVARRPALRRVGYPDAFEAAATTVLGQQVSVAAMRTFAGRLVARWGGPAVNGLRPFPRPAAIAGVPEDELQAAIGLTGARTRTLRAVAAAFDNAPGADGDGGIPAGGDTAADAGPAGTVPLTRAELLALPGIGPWSADYLEVRARLDPDAFAPGDLVLRRALGRIGAREAEARAEAWRPYRAHALFHLWTAEAYDR
ncbi:DNA-3-methyladenine glycosylase [Arthrobacter sp. JSM 101049]|uniref:DNA-3-methyladenine glycosylase family protein n=1 Tax=Arthrobacter sp. JSM 101049 TaxID=929097 RepID=UPI003565F082